VFKIGWILLLRLRLRLRRSEIWEWEIWNKTKQKKWSNRERQQVSDS